MTADDARDPLLERLGDLRRLTPDPHRQSRVRSRCHAALERRRNAARQPDPVTQAMRMTAAGLTLAAFSYAVAAAIAALRLTRSL